MSAHSITGDFKTQTALEYISKMAHGVPSRLYSAEGFPGHLLDQYR